MKDNQFSILLIALFNLIANITGNAYFGIIWACVVMYLAIKLPTHNK